MMQPPASSCQFGEQHVHLPLVQSARSSADVTTKKRALLHILRRLFARGDVCPLVYIYLFSLGSSPPCILAASVCREFLNVAWPCMPCLPELLKPRHQAPRIRIMYTCMFRRLWSLHSDEETKHLDDKYKDLEDRASPTCATEGPEDAEFISKLEERKREATFRPRQAQNT